MPSTRATTSDLMTRVERRIARSVHRAAGGNGLVSKSEQKTLRDTLLKDAATDVRTAGGPGARLKAEALIDTAVAAVESLVASANQPAGSGAAFISRREVAAMLTTNPAVGAHVAKAYELITGKRVTVAPTPAPSGATGQLGHNDLTQERLDLIAEHARNVARSGDMMTGSVPPGHYIIVPVTSGMPAGRSYNVHLPYPGLANPNDIERMILESIDAQGVTRTASFDLPRAGGHALVALDVHGIIEAPIEGLAVWHESGDHGVNVTSHPLPGVVRLDRALDRARDANPWTSGETQLRNEPETGAAALERFLGLAESTLLDQLPAGEDPASVQAFVEQVRASFSQLGDVRLATGGDLGGSYLVGKTADGYAAVVVQSYAH